MEAVRGMARLVKTLRRTKDGSVRWNLGHVSTSRTRDAHRKHRIGVRLCKVVGSELGVEPLVRPFGDGVGIQRGLVLAGRTVPRSTPGLLRGGGPGVLSLLGSGGDGVGTLA